MADSPSRVAPTSRPARRKRMDAGERLSGWQVLARLLAFLRPLAGWAGLSVLLGALTIAAAIGLMATSAYLISAAALRPSVAELQVAIVGVRFFGLSRGIFRYLERLTSHSANFRLLAQLRVWFYRRVEPLAPAGLVQARGGDLLARAIGDIDTLENFYVRVVSPPLVALVILAGMALFLGGFHPSLAAALALFMLLSGVALPWAARIASRAPGRHSIAARAGLSAALVDGIQGMAEVTAFGMQSRQRGQVAAFSAQLAAAQKQLAWTGAAQSALSGLLANLGMWAALLLGIGLVRAGQLDGVQLAVVALASLAAFEATAPLPLAAQLLETSLPAGRRLFEVADRQPPVTDPPAPLPHPEHFDLSVRGLTFRYAPGDQPALSEVSFDLPAGKKLAVVGGSGAGKSTLAGLLARLWDYQQGTVTLGGHDLRAYAQEDARRWISLVTQSTYLFEGSLRHNLLLARPDASEDELEQAARQSKLDEALQRLPQGFETRVGERGLKLSGGERQRVAIARALLRQSPILVLDEPAANLDALTARAFMDDLLAAGQGRSLVLITHRLAGLDRMDEILVMDAGRVIGRGRHDELLANCDLYRAMWLAEIALGGELSPPPFV